MRIEAVDFFYLAMPQILDIGDGSQDLLLVRVQAGSHVGWGECEASPLVTIASLVCPMSHSACKPVRDAVLGQRLESPEDIARIGDAVREQSLDLLQADHALSGIDIAMWDLIGKKLDAPVYQLLGDDRAVAKTPYASQLFGDTAEETFVRAQRVRAAGYTAAKFGWGPFGRGTVEADVAQVRAAREGLGDDGTLLIDAGTIWRDVASAQQRLDVLKECRVTFLEEPFPGEDFEAHRELASLASPVKLAGGEGCHTEHQARQMIDHSGIGYIQIDAGRIGGITPARAVAEYAQARRVTYVNHTFTSHLALSASLQPYAGSRDDTLCEYPVEPKPLAVEVTKNHLLPDANGQINLPERPGLGIDIDLDAARRYLLDVEITVSGRTLYRTPELKE
ncbi:MAG: mandelate racemase/muconate lactonizing enzyme family protein [Chloroflexota bacterium]|nr:mandelate racemase/muconate lactonizing enzyme family protein [Chloroflexota bacterium]